MVSGGTESARTWEARHPDRAAAERAFTRERRAIRKHWSHKVHGTPETHYRASLVEQGALARLHRSGAITNEEWGSALEIAAAYERIAAGVTVRTVSMETRVDISRSGDEAFFERLGAVRAERAYSAWRARLPGPAAPILDMIVGDISYAEAARIHRVDRRRARRWLLAALDLWPALIREARDGIDEATLIAAQARALA